MIPFIHAEQVRAALHWPDLMQALAQAFAEGAHTPTRHVHRIDDEHNTVLLLMPAWQRQQTGVKLVTVAPDNPRRGLATVHSIYVLMDTATGQPLVMLDGEELTLRRTAAASALAARWLARASSRTLLVVGTGSLAPYQAAAHCASRSIERIMVWGRDPEKAASCLARIAGLGVRAEVQLEVATDLPSACAQADIITAATTSTVPLIELAWLKPGTHVDLVGGFRPDMREADDALMSQGSLFVDTHAGALAEAGDLRQPMERGLITRESVRAELADLVLGRHPGRAGDTEITVFKSVGSAIEDLAAARLTWNSQPRPA